MLFLWIARHHAAIQEVFADSAGKLVCNSHTLVLLPILHATLCGISSEGGVAFRLSKISYSREQIPLFFVDRLKLSDLHE